METKDKFNFEFLIGKGLGLVKFKDTNKQIFNVLGEPTEKLIDIYKQGVEESSRYTFSHAGVVITRNMFESKYEPIKIFTEKIFINGHNLYDLCMKEIILNIEKIHKDNNINIKVINEKDGFESCCEYPNIGLTIWFNNDEELIDVCIELP